MIARTLTQFVLNNQLGVWSIFVLLLFFVTFVGIVLWAVKFERPQDIAYKRQLPFFDSAE